MFREKYPGLLVMRKDHFVMKIQKIEMNHLEVYRRPELATVNGTPKGKCTSFKLSRECKIE